MLLPSIKEGLRPKLKVISHDKDFPTKLGYVHIQPTYGF